MGWYQITPPPPRSSIIYKPLAFWKRAGKNLWIRISRNAWAQRQSFPTLDLPRGESDIQSWEKQQPCEITNQQCCRADCLLPSPALQARKQGRGGTFLSATCCTQVRDESKRKQLWLETWTWRSQMHWSYSRLAVPPRSKIIPGSARTARWVVSVSEESAHQSLQSVSIVNLRQQRLAVQGLTKVWSFPSPSTWAFIGVVRNWISDLLCAKQMQIRNAWVSYPTASTISSDLAVGNKTTNRADNLHLIMRLWFGFSLNGNAFLPLTFPPPGLCLKFSEIVLLVQLTIPANCQTVMTISCKQVARMW